MNFALGRIYSKFYRKCHISELKTHFLVKKAILEANLLIYKPNLWYDFLLYKIIPSCHWYSFFRNCQIFSNSSLFWDGGKIIVNKNAIKLVFHHNCDFYFSGEFLVNSAYFSVNFGKYFLEALPFGFHSCTKIKWREWSQ